MGAVGRAESEICAVGWTLPLCGLMTRETASCFPCKKGKFEGFLPDLKAQGSETESPALGHYGMGGVRIQRCPWMLGLIVLLQKSHPHGNHNCDLIWNKVFADIIKLQ